MAMSSGSDDDFVSEINVTPFVDVMLVLLIIFMVTAPMMMEGLDVDLPPVQAAEMLPAEDDHLILTVKGDASLFLDEIPVALEDLPDVLKAQVLEPKKQLFLRADKNVPYGAVADVMSRARSAGIVNIGMVTSPVENQAGTQDDAAQAPDAPVSDPAGAPASQAPAPVTQTSATAGGARS